MKTTKIISGALSIAMLASLMSGCGKPASSAGTAASAETSSTEEPYEVHMWFALPSVSVNTDEVERIEAKINEYTLRDLNMALDLTITPQASYDEQVQLELSSGSEDVDIFMTQFGYGTTWVSQNYVTDLSDLLQEYGQDILSSYSSEDLATVCKVGDVIFGVPVHKEISRQPVIFFRTDILEKYDIDVSNIKTLDDIDALYTQVAEKEPDMWMLAASGMTDLTPVDLVDSGMGVFALVDPANSTEVVNYMATDAVREWCEYNRDWFNNGWINPGAASDTEPVYTYIKSGQAFSFFSNSGHPLSESDQENNCGGIDLTMVQLGDPIASTSSSCVYCYAISSASRDPAKAMQMLNYINSSTEVMNLLNWGVEGEDYVVTENGTLDDPEGKDASTVGYHLGAGWALPNQFVCTPWVTDGPDIYEKMIEYNNNSISSLALGFNLDFTPIFNQLSELYQIKLKYSKALFTGAVDPDEYLNTMLSEMEAAGAAEVQAEIQRQLDEWLAQQLTTAGKTL